MSALVLFSGGLDSTVALALSVREQDTEALFIDYGQRNRFHERWAAEQIADYYKVKFRFASFQLPLLSSAITNQDLELEKGFRAEIPSSYVPCRNSILLSLACACAEDSGHGEVWTGFNYNDAQGRPSPDGRWVFLRALELAIALGSKCGVEGNPIQLVAPLIEKSKIDIMKQAQHLGVPVSLTRSCFDGRKEPCGTCSACSVRNAAEAELKTFSW